MFTDFNIIFFNVLELIVCTTAIVKLEKNSNKTVSRLRKPKHSVLNEKEIYDLYQPLIDKVIYIDDQLILLSQIISTLKTSENMPLDSASILNLAEYITNMSRNVFKDANMLINEIFNLDLNSAIRQKLQPRS
jgi:hypothetical protein